jgi:hypothetical protein
MPNKNVIVYILLLFITWIFYFYCVLHYEIKLGECSEKALQLHNIQNAWNMVVKLDKGNTNFVETGEVIFPLLLSMLHWIQSHNYKNIPHTFCQYPVSMHQFYHIYIYIYIHTHTHTHIHTYNEFSMLFSHYQWPLMLSRPLSLHQLSTVPWNGIMKIWFYDHFIFIVPLQQETDLVALVHRVEYPTVSWILLQHVNQKRFFWILHIFNIIDISHYFNTKLQF